MKRNRNGLRVGILILIELLLVTLILSSCKQLNIMNPNIKTAIGLVRVTYNVGDGNARGQTNIDITTDVARLRVISVVCTLSDINCGVDPGTGVIPTLTWGCRLYSGNGFGDFQTPLMDNTELPITGNQSVFNPAITFRKTNTISVAVDTSLPQTATIPFDLVFSYAIQLELY